MSRLPRLLVVPGLALALVALAPLSAAEAAVTPQVVVQQVALHAKDLKNYTLQTVSTSDKVAGTVTLDNCGYKFTTEKYRVARHQVFLLTKAGAYSGISNEVVAYDTAAHAKQAFNQWRASVTGCKLNTYLNSTVAGTPPMKYLAAKIRTESRLPIATNSETTVAVAFKGLSFKGYGLALIQLRGKVLDIVWDTQATPVTTSKITAVVALAAITGRKLAKI